VHGIPAGTPGYSFAANLPANDLTGEPFSYKLFGFRVTTSAKIKKTAAPPEL
jgi:hypothetical protein